MNRRPIASVLGAVALVGMLVSPYFALIYASVEKEQRLAQKIFYFHVPAAWVSFLAFFIVFVASLLYLWKKDRVYDLWAGAAAEVGLLFCTLVLLTGPIWARPIWNAWWVWDARLTTTLVLWMIYVAYMMLKSYGGDPAQNAKFRAVLGIVGFLDVPLIYVSVNIWRTLHPTQLVRKGGLQADMFHALMVCLATFTALFLAILFQRVSLARAEYELEKIRADLGEEGLES
jgi:heme exporter protein C